MSTLLQSPIEYLKGVGPPKGELMRKELQVHTFGELLHYYPFRYVDRSIIHKIKELNPLTQYIQLKGKITGFRQLSMGKQKRLLATFKDDTGTVELIWFQSVDFILKTIQPNVELLVFGKPTIFNGEFNIAHPEVEIFTDELKVSGKGLQPVYSSSEKAKKKYLDSKGIVRLTHVLVAQLKEKDVPEFLPKAIVQQYRLCSRFEAMVQIHFPKSEALLHEAHRRLKFEVLFLIQLQVL